MRRPTRSIISFFSLLIVEKISEKGYNFDLLEKPSFLLILFLCLVFLMAMLANLTIRRMEKKERKLPIVRSKQLLVWKVLLRILLFSLIFLL